VTDIHPDEMADIIVNLETELDMLYTIASNLFEACARMDETLARNQIGSPAAAATAMSQFILFMESDNDWIEYADEPSDGGGDQRLDSAPSSGEAASEDDEETSGPTTIRVHPRSDKEL